MVFLKSIWQSLIEYVNSKIKVFQHITCILAMPLFQFQTTIHYNVEMDYFDLSVVTMCSTGAEDQPQQNIQKFPNEKQKRKLSVTVQQKV